MATTATPITNPICWYCKKQRATTDVHLQVHGGEVVLPLCPKCVKVACVAIMETSSESPAATTDERREN